MMDSFNPMSEMDFIMAHKILMKGLIKTNGAYRSVNVGISSKGKIKTVFPTYNKVKGLCADLFEYLEASNDNFLIKSCVAHYLIESIHPFEDGNGRMGRFWHTLILSKNFEIFNYLPLETFIHQRQKDYYEALHIGQLANSPTLFVKLMLEVVISALNESFSYRFEDGPSNREKRFIEAKEHFRKSKFSRKDYLSIFLNLSSSMGTKDLKAFCNDGLLFNSGNGNGTRYYFTS
jgi:Fic family protein